MRMNKKILLLAMLALAAGCTQKEAPVHEGNIPSDFPVTGKPTGTVLTFSADATLTRTTLANDWSVSWREGDPVKILWKGGYAIAPARLDEGKARFSAVVDDSEAYYALYPASLSASVGADGSLSFDLPSSQNGQFEDCGVFVAHTTREALNFGRFRSAVGLIRFQIGDSALTRATFSAADDSPVCGKVSVDATLGTFTPQAEIPSIELTLDGNGTYYMAVPAGLTLPGLKFLLGTADELKGEASNDKPFTLSPGQILCVDAKIDDKMEAYGDVFVSDSAALIRLLSNPASGARLDGHTVHIAEGSYNLGESALSLSYGSATPLEITLEGDPGKTVITGSGESGLLSVASSAGVNLHLKGLTFKEGRNSGPGGALTLSSGSHSIENCVFDGNECTATAADKTGGAIYISGNTSADISGCSFTDNISHSTTGGGALALYTTGKVRLFNCDFSGNLSRDGSEYMGNGGAILQKKAGNLLYVVSCRFRGNGTKSNGPDIFTSAGAALLLYNDTFAHSTWPDAASLNCGQIRVNAPVLAANCTFVMDVSATQAGAGCNNGLLALGQNDNNVLVNNLMLTNAGYSVGTGSSYTGSTTRQAVSYGHNVYASAPKVVLTDNGGNTDLSGIYTSDVVASSALSASGLLEWEGPAVKLPAFVAASAADMVSVIRDYPVDGAAFYEYLLAVDAFERDAKGTLRGATWWPGAYQSAL